jgi:hypothetical protein
MYQPEPRLLEMAIQTVLHRNKASLGNPAPNAELIKRIASEIRNQFTVFQQITDSVIDQLENAGVHS